MIWSTAGLNYGVSHKCGNLVCVLNFINVRLFKLKIKKSSDKWADLEKHQCRVTTLYLEIGELNIGWKLNFSSFQGNWGIFIELAYISFPIQFNAFI